MSLPQLSLKYSDNDTYFINSLFKMVVILAKLKKKSAPLKLFTDFLHKKFILCKIKKGKFSVISL